jgi:hypothetical protein
MTMQASSARMLSYMSCQIMDKIAWFLYGYQDESYTSLHFPRIPLDRSNISGHGILLPQQVKDTSLKMQNMHTFVEYVKYVDFYHVSHIVYILHIMPI